MNHAIILAAGLGTRMKAKKNKLLLPAGGKPIIYYSIMAFNDHPEIETVTIVTNKYLIKDIEKVVKTNIFLKVKDIVIGGADRKGSLEKGIKSIKKSIKNNDDVVVVHNGANPLPSLKEISQVIKKTKETGACISGHYITSTIKEVSDKHIIKTHDRNKMFAAETPQAATYDIFKKALQNAKKKKLEVTDEAMMFEDIGQNIAFTEADNNNFKITTLKDYERLKTIFGDNNDEFRVGIGQDSHMFEENKKGLCLGGIKLENELKLKADSDGDVILHSIFNALSQAIGEKSLGFFADEICEKGVTDSKKYLNLILEKVYKKNFRINSLGLMIEAFKPKIDPLTDMIKKSLSELLSLEPKKIGITATTGEDCSAFGEGLGIQCFSIVSLRKIKND